MDGILLMNKPQNFTSFDVVAKLRGILKTKKLGHAGTLDPMATGVLPVFVGSATKACNLLPDSDKTYIASLRLGITTDTQDIWGKVTAARPHSVTAAQFRAAAARFAGEITQLTPMYSAVKVDGQRLYDIARKGGEVERPTRTIYIHSLAVLNEDEQAGEYTIEVSCSKGTYIRTLCSDIGESLGCGAAMTSLVRTKAAGFTLNDCLTFDDVQRLMEEGALSEQLIDVERAFMSLPSVRLSEEDTRRFKNGVKLDISALTVPLTEDNIRVYGFNEEFIGLGYIEQDTQLLRVRSFFENNMYKK
ncbi:tRNA pseudouridine(55) synthase TruB [Acetanaerobacterium elongatum]|uniref:tRNA pseudouridine synthase B n=1 Tax=Acetanaerobacterium elongatum TaxID=258515 RepID=A0A1G9WNE3_9FIRM|nr:tRNA pseudouridine(55) synthase TruB [Acetanaerobacterium elongatum]SDM86010.1 tRNA pseudouridine55 synthase [Acetanaerobacterium elongatum]